jgi:hypothetical protein
MYYNNVLKVSIVQCLNVIHTRMYEPCPSITEVTNLLVTSVNLPQLAAAWLLHVCVIKMRHQVAAAFIR